MACLTYTRQNKKIINKNKITKQQNVNKLNDKIVINCYQTK